MNLQQEITPDQRLQQIYEWVKVGHVNLKEFKMLIREFQRREAETPGGTNTWPTEVLI